LAVQTTYVITSDETYLDLIEGPGQKQVDVISLSGGRLAVTSTNGTNSDLDIFNANGTDGGGHLNFDGTLSSLTELTNGNIVVVVDRGDGNLNRSIRDPNGNQVLAEDFISLNGRDPDVAALSNGNYILARVENDNVVIGIPQNPTVQNVFTLDSGAVDERPSVTGLDGGGYAVAWSATRAGLTEVWYAVYENTGATRLAPTKLADTETIFQDVSIASMAGGGFAIAYGDNGADSNIVLATCSSTGTVGARVNVSNPGPADVDYAELQPHVARLSNGLLAIAYTRDYIGGVVGGSAAALAFGFQDDDTLLRIYDPTRGVLSDAAFIDAGQPARNNVQDAALADFGIGRIAAFHTNTTANDAKGEVFSFGRRSIGDGGNDVIVGDALIDDMRGGAGNDTLNGGVGNDQIRGGTGIDKLFGGDGNDTFLITGAEALGDTFAGGAGTDKIEVTGLAAVTLKNFKAATASIEQWVGNGKGILGDATVNTIDLTGLTSATNIGEVRGATGNDFITGSKFADTLNGGGGNDLLKGGPGSDFFVFNTALNKTTNVDRISDFNIGNDTIRLENAVFTKVGLVGALKPGAFALSTATKAADDRIIYNKTSGQLFYDSDGSGAAVAIHFATLLNKPVVNAADFMVI